MFECKDLLTLPSMAQAKIIAGKSGLSYNKYSGYSE